MSCLSRAGRRQASSNVPADGSGPREGTRVVGLVDAGAWAQFVAIPTNRLAAIPDEVSDAQAAHQGCDVGPARAGELDRHSPDAAVCAGDQHALAEYEAGDIERPQRRRSGGGSIA